MHVTAGLRQVLLMLLAGTAVAVTAAAAGLALSGGYRPKVGLALMLVGALLAVTGGTELSRHMTIDARAFFGAGPDREEPSTGGALTPIGVFLLVALPMLLVGGLVHGRG